jgi:hypothetical protein
MDLMVFLGLRLLLRLGVEIEASLIGASMIFF